MPENKVNKAVVCPMCGELGKAEIYTSVNVTSSTRTSASGCSTASCSRGTAPPAAITPDLHIRFCITI